MASGPLHHCGGDPRCPVLLPRGVARCPAHAVAQEHARANYAVRRWYRTARWKAVRQQVLTTVDPICRVCRTLGRFDLSTDVDHIRKHEGDEAAFWAVDNLQGLCKTHHSEKTQRGE